MNTFLQYFNSLEGQQRRQIHGFYTKEVKNIQGSLCVDNLHLETFIEYKMNTISFLEGTWKYLSSIIHIIGIFVYFVVFKNEWMRFRKRSWRTVYVTVKKYCWYMTHIFSLVDFIYKTSVNYYLYFIKFYLFRENTSLCQKYIMQHDLFPWKIINDIIILVIIIIFVSNFYFTKINIIKQYCLIYLVFNCVFF